MKMAEVNDLDSIDYDDDFEYQNQEQEQETTINENTQSDIISDLLKDRGIDDLNKIKFEEDDGTISERSWNNLSNDEKRLILNQTPEKDPEVDLDEQEIEMINQMRLHGMNPEQYVTALRNQGAQYAINQFNTEPNYETDDLTDDELFKQINSHVCEIETYKNETIEELDLDFLIDYIYDNEFILEDTRQGVTWKRV